MNTNPKIGIGLRSEHYDDFLNNPPVGIDWVEALTENYLDTFGKPREVLKGVGQRYPIALHGVGLSIARPEELDQKYILKVKELADFINATHVSDHLCWTGTAKVNFHNLLPINYNDKYLDFISDRFKYLQDFFKRPFYLENLSAYLEFENSTYTEWEFLQKLLKNTGCKLLLDVNNVYVNSINQNFDAKKFIDAIDEKHIGEIHLAGFTDMGNFLFDTHSKKVYPQVWDLFRYTLESKKIQDVPVLIEWDSDIPELPVLVEEAYKARAIWKEVYHD